MRILIKNGTIVNENISSRGYLIIKDDKIERVCREEFNNQETESQFDKIIDAKEGYIIPGVIDDQVHFREPGLTYKGCIKSESRAGLAGGVTSYLEMPNTKPPTTTLELLEEKNKIAQTDSYANYSFYIGATNDNISVIESVDPTQVCGVKVFMGSSTGNMLVDNKQTLADIFSHSKILVATHCESEQIVQANLAKYKAQYGENIPVELHPVIRSAEACYESSAEAAELAAKYGTRLHILHISSKKEMELFSNAPLSPSKLITCEVCVHHLFFDDTFYHSKGNLIKWNPAIKSSDDRQALLESVRNGKIDVVATDHAPHTIEEKRNPYLTAPSGGPLLSHSLVAMLELSKRGEFKVEMVVEKMSHAPAKLYNIHKRGFLREGYYADVVVVQKDSTWQVSKDNILYRCGWSPFEGDSFSHKVSHTLLGGKIAYDNGAINENIRGTKLTFDR